MSKENVLSFLSKAATDKDLKAQLATTETPDELVGVANQAGFDFSSEHVDEVITELKQKRGFFGALASALLGIFAPPMITILLRVFNPIVETPIPAAVEVIPQPLSSQQS